MIKYFIDEEAYNYLSQWSEDYRESVDEAFYMPYYNKKSQVILTGYDYNCYIEAKKCEYKFNITTKDDGQIIKGKFWHDANSNNDYDVLFTFSDKILTKDVTQYQHLMQVYLTAFVEVNKFMWLGNLVENKTIVAQGRNQNHNKLITLRKCEDKLYAVEVGRHRSPQGIFSVRGHLRKYKDGKIVWIDSYMKGM